MGTRSIIVIIGAARHDNEPEIVRLYKHWDGYPTGNLPIIKDALQSCLTELSEYNARFKKSELEKFTCEFAVGKLIGAATSIHGMGARVDAYEKDTAEYSGDLKPEHFGTQSDLEWIYVLDLEAKHLGIYGASYGLAVDAIKRGFTDPTSYAEQLRDECKADERAEIKKAVAEIEALGFQVNKKKLKFPRAKKAKPPAKDALTLVVAR